MNETTCGTVARANLQIEAQMDQSTPGQQSASPRHFMYTLAGIFLFAFLCRRFIIWKIIWVCGVLSPHPAVCGVGSLHWVLQTFQSWPLQPPNHELWGGEWIRPPGGETARVTLSDALCCPGDASPPPARKTPVASPCVSPVYQLIISEPKR